MGGEQSHRYRATRSFLELLLRLHCTLVVSVYTASRLVLIRASEGALKIRAHELLRPMGIAVCGPASRLASNAYLDMPGRAFQSQPPDGT